MIPESVKSRKRPQYFINLIDNQNNCGLGEFRAKNKKKAEG